MARILIDGFMCERCHHRWAPRSGAAKEPKNCPKCCSPYWNKPRKLNLPPEKRATQRPTEAIAAA